MKETKKGRDKGRKRGGMKDKEIKKAHLEFSATDTTIWGFSSTDKKIMKETKKVRYKGRKKVKE